MNKKASQINIRDNQLLPLAFLGLTSGSILHDISNPLSLLILDNKKSKNELEAYYRTIRALMHNNLQKESLNLSEILEDILIIFKEKSKRYDCKIKAIYPKNLYLKGFKSAIYNVLLNLISNACEAHINNRKKDKSVWIILKKYKNKILIEIIDNGCGIPKTVQKNIFEPFFSIKNRGSGLGLSLIKYYIEEVHNGEIKLESIPNKGSKFLITLNANNLK